MRGGEGRGLNLPANRVAAGIIWCLGLVMTTAALGQMTPLLNGLILFGLAVGLQIALTVGQTPVWEGRGSLFAYVLLGIDTVINFGGTMAMLVNVDQVGSVQALQATFLGGAGAWPMWAKGVLALMVSAGIAGLPEYFWNIKRG